MPGRLLLLSALAASFAVGQEPPTVEAIRKYALNYIQSLPDYNCTQVTMRVYSRQGFVPIGGGVFSPGLNKNDTIEEELSFVGGRNITRSLS
jgi:hypothetical protein